MIRLSVGESWLVLGFVSVTYYQVKGREGRLGSGHR